MHKVQDVREFRILYNNLHDLLSSLREEVWVHKTSLTPPLFIEVPVPIQENKRSCIWVLGVLILPLFLRFLYL